MGRVGVVWIGSGQAGAGRVGSGQVGLGRAGRRVGLGWVGYWSGRVGVTMTTDDDD